MNAYHGPDGQEDMPYLLTAGPVTTSRAVKIAMLADYAADDPDFASVINFIRKDLKRIAGCDDSHDSVLLQGAGQIAIEAAIGSLCPARRKKTLFVCSGADGDAAAHVMERLGRPYLRLTYRETTMPRASDVARTLDEDRSISHVWLAHVETSTGMLNPLQDIAQVVKARGRIMMLDATASFGGIALNMIDDAVDVLVGTAHACLESVPGVSFALAKQGILEAAAGQSHSPALDLHAHWQGLNESGCSFHTPQTHAVVALREALRELEAEGGVKGRSTRYQRNAETLRERLKALGLSLLLADVEASPMIQTVLSPKAATFDFKRFRNALHEKGFAISPGHLAQRPSFRVGCIGKVDEKIMQQVVIAIEDVLHDMDVRSFAPGDA